MTPKIRPTEINLNKRDADVPFLEIVWQDGRTCRYPLPQLREACPCVECRGGHQYMGLQHAPDNLLELELKPARSYTIDSIQTVGNYAVQPIWTDGHSTGIYTWEYLRHLCPSEAGDG